jgi:Animal haem peroxidase
MPPPVVACLLLFSRHHNHLAERLFDINETGKYKPWETLSEEERKWQDNDIFQLCRNINIAFFAKVVLTDYVSAILNTVRADSDWHLELGKEIKSFDGSRLERGTGNSVSCEFNVLYHWHAALSAADEKWMEGLMKKAVPDTDIEDFGPMEFRKMVGKHKAVLDAVPPSKWTFGGLERNPDGHFDNHALGELIKDAIEEPANAFGARGTPSCMKVVDVLGQLQARNVFNVCTMNEFRNYLNLAPFKSFEDWNPDPEIAHAAETLYGHIDQLELYPGLLAEEAKPNMPGSGVQPGHTIGRGILDDAVALVRGDRFLTHDLNASTLTNWGVAQLKPAPGAYGGFLSNLLFNALPNSWGKGFSTYNLLPFYTPDAITQILKANKKLEAYQTERPESMKKLYGLHSWKACKEAFEDRDTYRVFYLPNLLLLTDNAGFFIGYDDHTR